MVSALLERILFPLDGTVEGESTLTLLEPVLRQSKSELFLVRVVDSHSDHSFRDADAYLRRVSDRLQDKGVCAHGLVIAGSPSQVIERLAVDEEITLIALKTDPGEEGAILQTVLRRTAKPVMAVNPAIHPDADRPRRNVLVPLDGSEWSRRCLPLALEVAESLGTKVVLLRVIDRESQKIEALRDLREIADRAGGKGLEIEIWIESGDPAKKILEECRKENFQFVVLTTHGKSGQTDQAFGAVAQSLLANSPVPVLAVHVRGQA